MIILRWPLPNNCTKITTKFGELQKNSAGEWVPHAGIDISCGIGTPVYATHDGTVRYEWTQAGGNCLRLTGMDCYTRYCHLSSYVADDGEQVKAGEEIARSGNSGAWTTGAHLHFEVHLPDGTLIDPLTVMEVPMGIGKISLHFQNVTPWARDVVGRWWNFRQAEPAWVKVINPPVPDVFPNTHVVGRAFWHNNNDSWEAQCVAKGAAGGEEYFNYLLPYYQERKGAVTAWEAVNEPSLQTVQEAGSYADFFNAWNAKMHAAGFKTCGGSIGVGKPPLPIFGESNAILKIILPALVQSDYWSCHAYWDGRLDLNDNWWAFRYREIVKEATKLGFKLPPLIISECGCDHAGGKYDGWRARGINWEQYHSDLNTFGEQLGKDSYVISAHVFTSGPDSKWVFFELDESQADTVGRERMSAAPPVEVPHEGLPMDETATDAKTLVQKCRWWAENYQRQMEAGNTAYAQRIWLSLIQLLYRAENAF